MLSVTSVTQEKFDACVRRYVRPIFGFSRGTPNSIVTAVSRMISFRALQGRERARLCMQLANPLHPREAIAHAVLNGVMSERPGRSLAHANLPVRHEKELVRLEQLGVAPPPDDLAYHMVPVEAGLHGDRIALQQWQAEARLASGIPDPPRVHHRPRRGAPEPLRYITPLDLPRALPTEHAADIYFGFSQTIGAGAIKHGLVALSYAGPSGTSIAALSNKPCSLVSVVARLQTGNLALSRFPWRPRNPVRPSPRTGSGIVGADDELSDADTLSLVSSSSDEESGDATHGPSLPVSPVCDSETGVVRDSVEAETESAFSSDSDSDVDYESTEVTPHRNQEPSVIKSARKHRNPWRTQSRHVSGSRNSRLSMNVRSTPAEQVRASFLTCRHCDNGHEHPAHAFFECSAGRLPEVRELLITDALAQWERLLLKLEAAMHAEYKDSTFCTVQERSALRVAFTDPSRSAEARWLTHRLLWAIPWPARVIPARATAARALGELFDTVILSRHALRSFADSWVTWSSKWTQRFGAAWAELQKSQPATQDAVNTA